MTKNTELQPKSKPERVFTTGQISGISGLGRQCLYRYVKDFGEFFSDTARQHKQGRRWTGADLELVESIHALHSKRSTNPKIRELLQGGWRLLDDRAGAREFISGLVDMVFVAMQQSEDIAKEAMAAMGDLQRKTRVVEINNKAFQELWIQLHDIRVEFYELERELRIRTGIVKKVKPKWHGDPPEIFLQAVGSLEGAQVIQSFKRKITEDPEDPKKSSSRD
jgi:hypothetical protein